MKFFLIKKNIDENLFKFELKSAILLLTNTGEWETKKELVSANIVKFIKFLHLFNIEMKKIISFNFFILSLKKNF